MYMQQVTGKDNMIRLMPSALVGVNILAVDDCSATCSHLRTLARFLGARLRHADCLASATRHLAAFSPHILLVDIGLPDGSGADLINAVRKRSNAPALIALSGDRDRLASIDPNTVNGVMEKPIPPIERFHRILHVALEQAALFSEAKDAFSISFEGTGAKKRQGVRYQQ